MASTEVKFEFDREKAKSTNVMKYPTYPTNSMVEEYMLLANVAVAQRIQFWYPAYAILRRHPQPKMDALGKLRDKLGKLGFEFAFDGTKELAASLDAIHREGDEHINRIVRGSATRCMN